MKTEQTFTHIPVRQQRGLTLCQPCLRHSILTVDNHQFSLLLPRRRNRPGMCQFLYRRHTPCGHETPPIDDLPRFCKKINPNASPLRPCSPRTRSAVDLSHCCTSQCCESTVAAARLTCDRIQAEERARCSQSILSGVDVTLAIRRQTTSIVEVYRDFEKVREAHRSCGDKRGTYLAKWDRMRSAPQ